MRRGSCSGGRRSERGAVVWGLMLIWMIQVEERAEGAEAS